MITITILGIDPYLLTQISRYATEKIADIYECSKDEVDFFAPEGSLVHDGVEQNTWNILVRVHAPMKVKVMENQAVKILHEYLKQVCVNMSIEFYYYSHENQHNFFSSDHPRFMTEENSIVEDEEVFQNEEGEEPYVGDIFEEFNEEVDGKGKNK